MNIKKETLSDSIFKKYDIRGVIDETLNKEIAFLIGKSFGSMVLEKKEKSIVVGRDGRLSGPVISEALCEGLLSVGLKVIDIGEVVTPMLYFSTNELESKSGIMITGSHNPSNYNGFKMVLSGDAILGNLIKKVYQKIIDNDFYSGSGELKYLEIKEKYFEKILSNTSISRKMKIAIDCGNGIAGKFAGDLFRKLGCDVKELFCDVDGNFPNHHPDPAQPDNLLDLIKVLNESEAEIGLAFDGDGDRLGVVTKKGEIIFPDRQLIMFSRDILMSLPGAKIVFDVKCSRHVSEEIKSSGGVPIMYKTGHSLIKSKMKELNSPFGGEMSGHLFFRDRWYGFDDGLYAGVRLLELVSKMKDISSELSALPQSISTPELHIKLSEGENFEIIKRLKNEVIWQDAIQIIDIDGLRIEYKDGFGLVRASNTTPVLVLRIEAENKKALKRIKDTLGLAIKKIKSDVLLPF